MFAWNRPFVLGSVSWVFVITCLFLLTCPASIGLSVVFCFLQESPEHKHFINVQGVWSTVAQLVEC